MALCRGAAAALAAAGLAVGGAPAAGETEPVAPGRAVRAAGSLSEDAGARLAQKLADILRHALEPSAEVRLTPLSEAEVNAYLAHQGARHLPAGLDDPLVRIGDGRLSAEAIIDLDAIRESRERTTFDPVRYLGGKFAVTAGGRVRSGGGEAHVEVQTVTVGGVQVPGQVLQEVVRHFTRTPGARLDEPIRLPYGITEIRLTPGLAVIVQ